MAYRVGIIGTGFIGAVHIETLRRLGVGEAVALVDTQDAEAKARKLGVPKAYDNYKELIDKEKPDVVHICTPNMAHFEAAVYALERGIHVMCEKPLCMTLAEADTMVEVAKKSGAITGVNLINRFYPMAFEMRERVRSGDVGRIFSVHGGYLQDWLFLDTDYSWRLEPEQSGASRAVADIGSHWFDLMEFVTGQRIIEVLADLVTFHKTRKKPTRPVETFANMLLEPEDYEEVPINTEDYAQILFRTEGGIHGNCTISQVFAGRKNQLTMSVSGDKSTVYWNSEDSNSLWVGKREGPNLQIAKDPAIVSPATRDWMDFPGGHVEGYPDAIKENFKAFYKALDANNQDGSFADFEAGRRAMLLCERIMQSSREQRWTTV